jgi:hypothetical protein
MDHKEQHHQHHQKEREEKKKEQKQHERARAKNPLPVHPAWLLGLGVVLVLLVVLAWTLFFR